MEINSRQVKVWLVSFGVLLMLYVFYGLLNRTPQIEIFEHTDSKEITKFSDSNVGMVGKVGVGNIENAEFVTLNKDKTVNREFGFAKLLHDAGNAWEIEKPYMNIFRKGFKCLITADMGDVMLEAGTARPTPKDATLIGNVVVHVIPELNSSVKECYIYLNDIIFVSEKSQFSTEGPVRFVSKEAEMIGKGLNFVYNEQLDMLDFLRIKHLEKLTIKTVSKEVFASDLQENDKISVDASSSKTPYSFQKAIASEHGTKRKRKASLLYAGELSQPPIEKKYKCLFSGNVIIDCPDQLVFADELYINNIMSSSVAAQKNDNNKSSSDESAKENVTKNTKETAPQLSEKPVDKKLSNEIIDIVVTCDNGILVVPMESKRTIERTVDTVAGKKELEKYGDPNGRATLAAERIDYCTVAREVDLTGNCLCTMNELAVNDIQKKHTLYASSINTKLSRRSSKSDTGIQHLTARGKSVKLASVKMFGEDFIGGVELKCVKFDYYDDSQMFTATGPGVIKIDNSKIAELPRKEKVDKFSIRKQCYAVVRNFDILKFYIGSNYIIADGKQDGMFIDYIPLVKGEYGPQTAVTTRHVKIDILETDEGRTEIASLYANGGFVYEEEKGEKRKGYNDKKLQFVGSEMLYDAKSSLITANGDELQPCLLDGVLVDGINYNLKSGKLKGTKIKGPGMLQLGE